MTFFTQNKGSKTAVEAIDSEAKNNAEYSIYEGSKNQVE